MWIKIFIFLWIAGTVKYKSTPIPNDCAKRVQKCPTERDQWLQGTNLLKCATNYGYVCLKDSSGHLLESCMANFTIEANTSNCPIVIACKDKKPLLGTTETYYHCPEEVPGCPQGNHAEYSIYQLYKYPACMKSKYADETEKTSTTSTTSIPMTTISTDQVIRREYIYIAIAITASGLLLTVVGCIVCYTMHSRKKHKAKYAPVRYVDDPTIPEEDHQDLRCWIRSINESEADRIRILPLKENDTIELDRIYVPLSITDEYQIRTGITTERQIISDITPDKMFYIGPGKPARFVFMLGDAGYGKTVQCRRIAKSWCKAWKDEISQGNDIHVKELENTKNGKLKEWEKILKDFEYLFYVPMRDVNNERVNVKDMIHDYYRRFGISKEHLNDIQVVLRDKRCKCLIILDGLDEWNISECKRENLLNKGIPNREDMLSCTFLITMRSWRFMEVEAICRQGSFDKIIRLHGFGSNGFEKLTINMLCNYFNIEKDSQEYMEQCTNLKMKASTLPELGSLMKIPLLAVFYILAWHEKIETGHSLTTFYLSVIEALMKKSNIQLERHPTFELNVSGILKNFPYVSSRIPEICRLSKLDFKDLDSHGRFFILKDVHLKDPLIKETVDLFLTIGLLTKHDTTGQIHEDNVRFTFLHKTLQEFMYTLYLVYDRSIDVVKYITNMASDIEKTLDLSTVLTFVSGLSPAAGCKVSSHIAGLSSTDTEICRYRKYFASEVYYKVLQLFNLQLSCYREVRGGKSIQHFQENEMKFILCDIFLHGNVSDRRTIRDSADILHYHANDIKSLYMKLIQDDNQEGISNIELTTFLDESKSLLAFNIDGYDRGKCRLFDNFPQITPCLQTIGFHNVAFTDNILTDFLTKEDSKRSIKALGLFYIKSADHLVVDYQYQFPSVSNYSSVMSGYVQKRKMCPVPENSTPLREGRRQPLLEEVLNVLPNYGALSTLHVSYMDSDEDRHSLLQVVPEIKSLEHFGYHGSSIYEIPDDAYDTKVIKILLNIERLQVILLCQIILEEDILIFTRMSQLRRIRLQQFEMKESKWMTFAKSLLGIPTLHSFTLVLYDTNIDEKTLELLEESPITLVKDDSKEWCEYETT